MTISQQHPAVSDLIPTASAATRPMHHYRHPNRSGQPTGIARAGTRTGIENTFFGAASERSDENCKQTFVSTKINPEIIKFGLATYLLMGLL